jgi:hypothetical protein
MMRANPKTLILIGFFLVLFGFVMPFLMTIHLIESSFWLSFLSHAASVGGMFLGFIGSAMYIRIRRE